MEQTSGKTLLNKAYSIWVMIKQTKQLDGQYEDVIKPIATFNTVPTLSISFHRLKTSGKSTRI